MRRIVILVVGVLVWAATAAPALAEHTHVMLTGNGSCVILAANGWEKDVWLPPAVDGPATRRHPIHLNVHLGQHGTRHGDIWVQGSAGDLANCEGYLND
ncbi:MAG: hypothetical protein ACLGHX_14715 [Acidimicrobiia bacterium]